MDKFRLETIKLDQKNLFTVVKIAKGSRLLAGGNSFRSMKHEGKKPKPKWLLNIEKTKTM